MWKSVVSTIASTSVCGCIGMALNVVLAAYTRDLGKIGKIAAYTTGAFGAATLGLVAGPAIEEKVEDYLDSF